MARSLSTLRLTVTGAALFAALSLPVQLVAAHELAKGPNGGPVVDSGGYHIEFVAGEREIVLFLTGPDHKPTASAGVKTARAIVQDGGKTASVPLVPAEPNRLVGTLPNRLGSGARVVVTATLPGGHSVQGRFVSP